MHDGIAFKAALVAVVADGTVEGIGIGAQVTDGQGFEKDTDVGRSRRRSEGERPKAAVAMEGSPKWRVSVVRTGVFARRLGHHAGRSSTTNSLRSAEM